MCERGQEILSGGVRGSVEYSKEDGCWHGKILGISDLISYEGETYEKLYDNFAFAVHEWHKDRCELEGGTK